MRFIHISLAIVVLFIASACTTTTRTASTEKSSAYSEDLSVWRTAFLDSDDTSEPIDNYVEQPVNLTAGVGTKINDKLHFVLDSINVLNKQNKFLEGFSIQVYSGLSRDDAMNVKAELFKKLPEVSSDLMYSQPSFRVKVGKYYSKLEAQKDFMVIKRHFPNAILVPERIYFD